MIRNPHKSYSAALIMIILIVVVLHTYIKIKIVQSMCRTQTCTHVNIRNSR